MSDSRKRFEEWAKERGLQYDAQNVSRYEGWSARDSEVERLREALRELHEAESAVFPPAIAGAEAQRAWSDRKADAHDAAARLLSSQDKESA